MHEMIHEILDDSEVMRKIDKNGMLDILYDFPEQIEEALRIADKIEFPEFKPYQIVIAGVGGSAIGGSLLASWLYKRIPIPIFVNRAYRLPTFVGSNTLMFAISYSGNTEETISLFTNGLYRGCKIIGITSGGRLEELLKENEMLTIKIPTGYPPRASIGLLFFPVIKALQRMGIYDSEYEVGDALGVLKSLREKISPEVPLENNPAKQIALKLKDKIPIIYGHTIYIAIASRWKSQLNENSKIAAWYGTIPEMNHNEITGWVEDERSRDFIGVFLRDEYDKGPIGNRVDVTKKLIFEDRSREYIEVYAEGDTYLSRMLYSMYIGDYVSAYLALLRGVDPTPVEILNRLKEELRKK